MQELLYFCRKLVGAPTRRYGHSSSLVGSTKLFIFGGRITMYKYFNHLHVLNAGPLTTDEPGNPESSIAVRRGTRIKQGI